MRRLFIAFGILLGACSPQAVPTQSSQSSECYSMDKALADAKTAGWKVEEVPAKFTDQVKSMINNQNKTIDADTFYIAARATADGDSVFMIVTALRGCFEEAYIESDAQ
jgi:non-homologous end joining protein Ku